MQIKLKKKIEEERAKIKKSKSHKEKYQILYNIIVTEFQNDCLDTIYRDIKLFLVNYFQAIKLLDFGYDNLNYVKIERVIQMLSPTEQTAIIHFAISEISKELPEYDKTWFLHQKRKAKIREICKDKQYYNYPLIIILYFGQSIKRLFILLLIIYFVLNILLLPAPFKYFEIFEMNYNGYSDNLIFNHLLNTLLVFAKVDGSIIITPTNWRGILIIVLGKISFWLLIINFIYIKITEEILKQ